MDQSLNQLPGVPRPRILVVDDQTANILLIRELFKDECEIFMALDGEQAIAQCQALMPDLILLDLVMPGIDGFEVCRRLKEDPRTRAVPVIFISAQREEADEARGFELGGVDYIVKPVNRTILRARVRTHLALKFQTDLLNSIALMDGLTGVANRRKFDEELQTSWLLCARQRQPVALLLLDVDYFKRFNDRYGTRPGTTACARWRRQCAARCSGRTIWPRATAARNSPASCRTPTAKAPRTWRKPSCNRYASWAFRTRTPSWAAP